MSIYEQVASTWEDVKSLRQDMDKSSSSGAVLLRSKLLQAANQLQVCNTDVRTKSNIDVIMNVVYEVWKMLWHCVLCVGDCLI